MSLTPEQINIIKTSWKIPSANPVDSGEAILLSYFGKYPQNQKLFKSFKDVPLDSLKGNAALRSHGTRVVTVFDNAVKCLDSDNFVEELDAIWSQIGLTHAKRNISKDSFLELQEVIVDILIEVCSLDSNQQVAWKNFFKIVFAIIFKKLDL